MNWRVNIQNLITKSYQLYLNYALLLLFSQICVAQVAYERSTEIPFSSEEQVLKYALCGGLNNPQFNEADLNNDGINDLVIFDRSDNSVLCFINNGIQGEIDYSYTPLYEKNFPEMEGYLLMRDFNCDGIADIFTPNNFDVEYFEGTYNEDNQLTFTLVSEQLRYSLGDFAIEIADTDYPEIADIDNDGLLDVLTFNEEIGGTVNFFKNVSNDCSGLDFIKADTCWGDFYESGLSAEIIMNNCGEGKSAAHNEMHPGSTLLTLDIDGDGDRELITGDINSNFLTFMLNGGTKDDALITMVDPNYPSTNIPVDVLSFPASFLVDVDNDGDKDFLAAPNSKAATETYRSSWLYINSNNDQTPAFNYSSDRFIISETADYGRESYPVFVDVNNDGLFDIISGNYGNLENSNNGQYVSSLSYFRNIGTAEAPAFQLITNDYAGFSGFLFQGIRPTFGDVDNDGDPDLIFGLNGNINGEDLNGTVFLSINEAPVGEAMQLSFPSQINGNMDVGQAAAPHLADVNKDGLLDLIVGEFNGNMHYFKNTGTATVPNFEEINDVWGNIDVKDPAGSGKGVSYPHILELENDSIALLVGSFDGSYYLFNEILENSENDGTFNLFTSNWFGINDTEYSTLSFADIDNDGMKEMISGSRRGGFIFYEAFEGEGIDPTSNQQLITNTDVRLYPNPSKDIINIITEQNINAYQLFNTEGKLLLESSNEQSIDISKLSKGIYFLNIYFEGNKIVSKKVSKL